MLFSPHSQILLQLHASFSEPRTHPRTHITACDSTTSNHISETPLLAAEMASNSLYYRRTSSTTTWHAKPGKKPSLAIKKRPLHRILFRRLQSHPSTASVASSTTAYASSSTSSDVSNGTTICASSSSSEDDSDSESESESEESSCAPPTSGIREMYVLPGSSHDVLLGGMGSWYYYG